MGTFETQRQEELVRFLHAKSYDFGVVSANECEEVRVYMPKGSSLSNCGNYLGDYTITFVESIDRGDFETVVTLRPEKNFQDVKSEDI